jgi:aminoglycoside phosphotransferase (APT) family kinase protein
MVDGKRKSFVLQMDPQNLSYEYQALKAMENIPIPTPRVYGLDNRGEALGFPCFFSDFIEGDTLLEPMLSGDSWAKNLYLDMVIRLQSIRKDQLGEMAMVMKHETTEDVLEGAYSVLRAESHSLAKPAYDALRERMPALPPLRFSNGDLWLENFIVRERELAGVIDFANACFSDPIYEFLLSFFVEPELQGRGIEERYLRSLGFDPSILDWYHGLEYFDTLRWVVVTGETFVHHTRESLEEDLKRWLGI